MRRAFCRNRKSAAAFAAGLAIASLSGCSTSPEEIPDAPPPPTYSEAEASRQHTLAAQQQYLNTALIELSSRRFDIAKEHLTTLIEHSDTDAGIRYQAKAALVLYYLDTNNPKHNIERATTELDALYRLPRGNSNELLLFSALQRALENALHLSDEYNRRLNAERQGRKLEQEAIALQIALEKLRKLSLQ
jgi:hypothetical protein